MGEFKFACPVCGQHITADSTSSGSQLECPTCYRKIVVPQAPKEEQKLILSASEVNKPRPVSTTLPSESRTTPARSSSSAVWLVAAILLIAAGAAGFFLLRKKAPESPAEKVTETQSSPSTPPHPANTVEWTLDLNKKKFPPHRVGGKIRGRDFQHDRAFLQGGQLSFRLGSSGLTDLGIAVFLPGFEGEQWSGRTITIEPTLPRAPRAQLRWKDGTHYKTENYTNGYAMKLEFGQAAGGVMPGKIYLCTPDPLQSCVAGTFDAEIRKPAPPKPKAPTQKRTNKPPANR